MLKLACGRLLDLAIGTRDRVSMMILKRIVEVGRKHSPPVRGGPAGTGMVVGWLGIGSFGSGNSQTSSISTLCDLAKRQIKVDDVNNG